MAYLLSHTKDVIEDHQNHILNFLANFLWLCHILPKMDPLTKFLNKWIKVSNKFIYTIKDIILRSCL